MSNKKRRLASTAVPLGITALLATSLAGCASAQPEDGYAAVCTDPATQERVDDDYCDEDSHMHNSMYGWYFIPYLGSSPGVGSKVTGGTFVEPNAPIVRGGVPTTGGKVSSTVRSGFGSSHGFTSGKSGGFGGRGIGG